MIAHATGYNRGSRSTGGARASAHMQYLEYRTLGEEESRESRHIFSEESDHVSRREAVEDIMDHTSTSVNYHKFVLSPDKDEPVKDWHAWTREVMSDLEERKGLELHWYAVHHENTDNPHVHVVLAGAGENEHGDLEPVKMYADDYRFLEASGQEHSEHDFYQHIHATVQELDRSDDLLPNQRQGQTHEQEGLEFEH